MFSLDMKKQVSTKQLLQTLLQTYMDTHDLEKIYKEDGSELITVDEAVEFVDGLKEEASPEQVEFESALDNMMEEFRSYFPNLRSFNFMHNVWNKHVQVELMKKYSNL